VGPARFATAGRRRLTLLFAGACFGRIVSGASTHHIAAAVTLVGACGVPDSTSRPANGGASDTDLPRLLRLEKPEPESSLPLTSHVALQAPPVARLQPIGSCDSVLALAG
jgi:hypothetical protein